MKKSLIKPSFLLLSALLFVIHAESIVLCGNNYIDSENENRGNYYYVMDKNKQLIFLNNIKKLRKGDFVLDVKSILGEPDLDQDVANKKKGTLKYRVLEYYIKKFEKNVVNEKYDRSVNLIFDLDNRLVIIISNVEGFEVPKELKKIPNDDT